MATGSRLFWNPMQKYNKNSSHSKSDCLLVHISTTIRTKRHFEGVCTRTD